MVKSPEINNKYANSNEWDWVNAKESSSECETYGDDIHKGSFSWELQANKSEFHFLLPKQRFEPVENAIN